MPLVPYGRPLAARSHAGRRSPAALCEGASLSLSIPCGQRTVRLRASVPRIERKVKTSTRWLVGRPRIYAEGRLPARLSAALCRRVHFVRPCAGTLLRCPVRAFPSSAALCKRAGSLPCAGVSITSTVCATAPTRWACSSTPRCEQQHRPDGLFRGDSTDLTSFRCERQHRPNGIFRRPCRSVQAVSKSFGPVRACSSAALCRRCQHHAALCGRAWSLPYAGSTRKIVWPCAGLLVCCPVQAFPTSRGPVRARSLAALCRLNKKKMSGPVRACSSVALCRRFQHHAALCGRARSLSYAGSTRKIVWPCAGMRVRCPVQAFPT